MDTYSDIHIYGDIYAKCNRHNPFPILYERTDDNTATVIDEQSIGDADSDGPIRQTEQTAINGRGGDVGYGVANVSQGE